MQLQKIIQSQRNRATKKKGIEQLQNKEKRNDTEESYNIGTKEMSLHSKIVTRPREKIYKSIKFATI